MDRVSMMLVLFSMTGIVGCGGGGGGSNTITSQSPQPQPDPDPIITGEYITLPVLQPGFTDQVDVYFATPDQPGPLPVVVYMHGFGRGDVARCRTSPALRRSTERIVEHLAGLGFIAAGVAYRSQGPGAPDPLTDGVVRIRDSAVLDAAAMLTAANYAHDEFEQAGTNGATAFIGNSVGTSTVLWGVSSSSFDNLDSLRDQLDIRTTIVAGNASNQIAGYEQTNDRLERIDNGNGMVSLALLPVLIASGALALEAVSLEDIEGTSDSEIDNALDEFLTPTGREVAARFLFEPAGSSGEACQAIEGLAPICSTDCLDELWAEEDWVGSRNITGSLDLVTPVTREALTWWRDNVPEGAVGPNDPGPDSGNGFLDFSRQVSPVYLAEGPAQTNRALIMFSTLGDENVDMEALVDQNLWLTNVGGLTPIDDTADNVSLGLRLFDPEQSGCGHLNYFDRSNSECGLDRAEEELQGAFN